MKHSAGLAITFEDKLLVVHPTRAPWRKMFGIPKGTIEPNETEYEAAIRETQEEIGFQADRSKIDKNSAQEIFYINKKGKKTKRVVFFEYKLDRSELPNLGIDSENLVVPKERLQIAEVDWAGFISKSSLKDKMLPNQYQMVKLLSFDK